MTSNWRGTLGTAIGVAVVLATYHAAFGGRSRAPAPRSEAASDIERLRGEIARLDADVRASNGAGLASGIGARLAVLESRAAALEAGPGPSAAPLPASASRPTWTESDVRNVQEMLDELSSRSARDREEAAILRLLEAAGADAKDPKTRDAVALVYGYYEAIRPLWKRAFDGGRTTPDPEVLTAAGEARKRLVADLGTVLPAAVLTRLEPWISDLSRDAK